MAGLVPAIHALYLCTMPKRTKSSAKAKREPKRKAESVHPAYGAMKGLIRFVPGVDLTQPADPGLADYLDAKYGKEKREK